MLNPKAVETKGNKKFLHRGQAVLKRAATVDVMKSPVDKLPTFLTTELFANYILSFPSVP